MSDAEFAMRMDDDQSDNDDRYDDGNQDEEEDNDPEESSDLQYSVDTTMDYTSSPAVAVRGGSHRQLAAHAHSHFRDEERKGSTRVVKFAAAPVDENKLLPHEQQQQQQQALPAASLGATKEPGTATSASSTGRHRNGKENATSSHRKYVKKPTSKTAAALQVSTTAESPRKSTAATSPLKAQAGDWIAQLAYSFRSPQPTNRHHPVRNKLERDSPNEKSDKSNSMKEYPGLDLLRVSNHKSQPHGALTNEITPLLGSHAPPKQQHYPSDSLVGLAAAFLQDYENNRPPTFSADFLDVSQGSLALYRVKFSALYQVLTVVAVLCLFCSSGLESFAADESRLVLTVLNLFALTVLSVDLWMRHELSSSAVRYTHHHPSSAHLRARHSRSERLIKPVIMFAIILGLENTARLVLVTRTDSLVLFSSFFKPLVLFYVSSQARDALEALGRIIRIVVRVLAIELLLILMFAAVACRLFQAHDNFRDLPTAWLSLFELATTVVNPGIWMPMYEENKLSALFFIFFIVSAVFYLHSLVLSVVFSTYIQAAGRIHERSATDREDAVELAFVALQQQQHVFTQGKFSQQEDEHRHDVDIVLVGEALCLVRPHYNAMKINALLEIVDPTNKLYVNYTTFRTKIRQALNASIRTPRNASTLAMTVELVAVAVAIINFSYVILVSSTFDHEWFNAVQERVGIVITLVAGFEVVIRFNPLRIPGFTPLTRLNATFDGLALAAAFISSVGIVRWLLRWDALEYILIGRAVDMTRVMRFFQIFRDVVRRSTDVLPALAGPIILVITTLHIFVYVGMALWGGAIHVGSHAGEIEYLYDLNNFNSYQEGMVTMFQILVVNDWYAIAEVFLYADRCSSPYIVYPFFIIGNLVGVSIMLNVLTAFFVESFVTKLEDGAGADQTESTTTVKKVADFSIVTAENTNISVRRISATSERERPVQKTNAKVRRVQADDNGSDHGADADSEGSSASDFFEFDVYEREGFDKIMQTVAGAPQSGGDFARHICNYLEIFESLATGRETVGYLVCDQQTLERFGNRRFQTKAISFLDENQLHLVVSDMHSELMALSSRPSFDGRSLIRSFPHGQDPRKTLEISASILRQHPAVSLFVSRIARQAQRR